MLAVCAGKAEENEKTIKERNNQLTNQPTKQPSNQPIKQPSNQAIKQPSNQQTNTTAPRTTTDLRYFLIDLLEGHRGSSSESR